VVNEVTCLFEGGKLNSVVGPSGSGKTTLLSLMAGLDQPNQGQIYIDDELLGDLDLDQYRRERVSMIFQAFHLFPLLTALENVCFPMQLNGVSKEEIPEKGKALLASVGIAEENSNAIQPISRVGSSSASRSPEPLRQAPMSCWPMNPPEIWIGTMAIN
jgi:putative ABC transport system ATP-binding protein